MNVGTIDYRALSRKRDRVMAYLYIISVSLRLFAGIIGAVAGALGL